MTAAVRLCDVVSHDVLPCECSITLCFAVYEYEGLYLHMPNIFTDLPGLCSNSDLDRIQVHEAGQTTFVQARVSTVARHVVRSTVGGHHSVFQCICFTFPGIATLQQFTVCHPGEDGVVMR